MANQSLQSGSYPSSEKLGRLTPVYKSGEKSSFDNYWTISVLNIMAKALEEPMQRQLSEYLEHSNLLSCSQVGFRREGSTQQAVTLLTEHVCNEMDHSRCKGALFMDLRKAFDLSKMEHCLTN